MQPALFDTSIYISAFQRGDDAVVEAGGLSAHSRLWLSAVVLEELYAGASRQDVKAVEDLERHFTRVKRIVVPNVNDWIETGRILAGFAAKYHYERIGRGRLTNDALIATSAGRLGITVITANARDFERLAEIQAFRWRVAVL
jgi:predicted nucleic acid-binding protein